jgi:hypothetical protein
MSHWLWTVLRYILDTPISLPNNEILETPWAPLLPGFTEHGQYPTISLYLILEMKVKPRRVLWCPKTKEVA